MKKIIHLLLVLALVLTLFAFTACGGNEETPGTDSGTNGDINSDINSDLNSDINSDVNNQQPAVDEDLQAAFDYIKLTYKTLSTTANSFEIMKNAPIGEKIFAITWSTNNESITITETEDGNFYVVNIPALGEEAVNYELKFSIENEAGDKKEGSFNLTIPAFAVNTHDEYVAAEDGTSLIIQGIVTGVISKSTNSTKENSLFLQDLNGNGGYYVYNLAEDPAGKFSVGMTVEVRGEKKNYNGTYELVNATATIIDSEIKPVTPVDFTEALAGASSLDAAELVNKNGMLVTIKGVVLLEYNESNGYHYFKLGDHKSYLRVSSSSNCITKDEGKTVTEFFNSNFYNGADVTGLIAVYNGDMYLMPVSAEPFTNIVQLDKPADVKVDTALENTTINSMIQIAGDVTLPTTFSGFDDVTIAWELVATEGVDCATLNGNILTVTIPASAQTVTLKATATCGTESDSKNFEIVVKPISTVTIQEALNIGDLMAHNKYTEELYYIVGTVETIADTSYGNLYLVEGDYSIYVYGLYDSTGKVRYDAMDPQPLPKDTIKVLSSIGKYSTTVQLKNAKVVEHTVHEDNKTEVAPTIDFKPVNPILNTEYFFGMSKNGNVYYITGLMGTGSAKYYMASTAKQADAAKVTVIAGPTADTYYITVTVSGDTKYLDIVASDTHRNAVYSDAAPAVGFSFDAETKTFYKDIEGENYTFGTALDNTYTTIGGVKLDAKNAMLQISFAAEHTCEFDDVVTEPKCEVAGYTTHTCACGNVVVDTPTDALQHEWGADGVCTRPGCGASNHEHDYDVNVTEPTCTADGYTTYTCKVPGCKKSYTDNPVPKKGHSYTDGVCANGCGIDDPDYYYAISIADALKAPVGKKVVLKGVISSINSPWSTQFKNMEAWLSDGEGNEILLYRIATQVEVGDKVTVQGVIGQYNKVNQIAQNGSTVTIDEKHVCSEFTDATCQKLAECVVCGEKTGDYADHTYEDGTCTICGHSEGAAEVETTTATLTYSTATTTNMTGNNDAEKLGLDASIFEVIGNKGSTNNNCGLNKSFQIRLYGSSSNGNGSYFTVTSAEGYTIKSIKITFTNNTNNKNCQLTVGETSTIFDGSSTTWEIDINANSFKLQNVIKGATTQIYISSIEITYVVPAAE